MARFFELPHLITLLFIILLIFGASRLPDIARNLGKSAKIIKDDLNELRSPQADTTTKPTSAPSNSDSPINNAEQMPKTTDEPNQQKSE